jgi:two-component system sensor histidine kinase CreC
VIPAVVLAAVADVALFALVFVRLWRSRGRGVSTRMRLFGALASSVLLGALTTGLYAVAVDVRTIGFVPRLSSVAPKAFVLASGLLAVAAAVAAIAGRRLARSAEQLADAAGRIAEGQRWAPLPRTSNGEARRIARALVTLRGEVANRPYAAAFLRDAWHDLKTPLAAIRATLEVLEDGALDDPEAGRRFVANLSRSARELDRRLADLVTLARMETASLDREAPAPVEDLIARAIVQVAPLAAARGVALNEASRAGHRAGTEVRCDALAIGRALANLLENAVDASPGGAVSVSVDAEAKDAVLVDVVNEPAAVPREMRGHLFERAVTAGRPGREGKRNGSGLGLAIARAAIEAHGGRVSFVELGPPRVRVRVELPR